MKQRWVTGIWLGKAPDTDDHIVSIPGGQVVRARVVQPKGASEVWNRKLFDELKGTPSDPQGKWFGSEEERPAGTEEEVRRIPVPKPAVPIIRAPPPARRVPINRRYLEKFGFTEGCSKCRAIRSGDESQPTLGHSESCRKRIE